MERQSALRQRAGKKNPAELRKSGIEIIGDLPWGTHFSHFYEDRDCLLSVLVPFFKAGLESNEFCMWITADPVGVEDAMKAMRQAMPHFEYYLSKKQIEIIPYSDWYTKGKTFYSKTVLEGWVAKYIQGLARGFQGLRASGNTSWLNKEDWDAFIRYEREVDNVIGSYRMIALCSYSLERCGAEEVLDVVSSHPFALIKRRGRLEVIERSEQKLAEEVLLRANRELERKVDERTSELVGLNGRINEESRRLKAFFDHVMTPLAFLDRDFNFIMVSRSYAKEAGREVSDFAGKNHFELYPHEENQRIFASVVRDKKPFVAVAKPFEYPDHPEWGVTYWDWSLVPILDGAGEVEFLVFSLKDVTEMKRAELALKRSEGRFRALVETTSDWVWEVDRNAVYTYVSPKIREILGYEPEEVIGKTPFDLMPPDEASRISAVFNNIAVFRRPFSMIENVNAHKDGRLVTLETSGAPFFNEKGGFAGYRGIDRDVTERKAVEAERGRLAADSAKVKKTETLEALAGNISDGFSNILTTISSLSDLALKEGDERLKTRIADIHAASARATELLKQVYLLGSPAPTGTEPLDLNAVAEGVLGGIALPSGIQVKTHLETALWAISGNKGGMEQIITGLASNAREAMDDGGMITVSTSNVLLSGDEPSGRAAGPYVCLSVKDTGRAIDEEAKKGLFAPLSEGEQGKGPSRIGLLVVDSMVKAHHGWVEVESSPEEGSVFRVYIPALRGGVLPGKAVVTDDLRGNGERVLFIEDEKALRKSVSTALSISGYTVLEAEGAEEAASIFSKEGADLVMTDLVLHGKNGVAIAGELSAKNPGLPVIVTSGYMDTESEWPLIKEKGFRFLQKPFSLNELLKTIKTALRNQ
ncbi:MAG: MEDS domain-containing protein [Deltaproteobacteria bacterium]|nr:MEDS domain-containing protein [Deltaproteobacteria bacterium]